MTVFRAMRGAARLLLVPLAVLTLSAVVSPAHATGQDTSTTVTSTTVTSTTSTTTVTSTTQVASEAPTPGVGAGEPRVGPLDDGVGGGPSSGVWWLFGLGGLQVAGLFVMTRRWRARLSTPDVAP